MVVNQVVCDNVEKEKNQKPGEYILYVITTCQQSNITWSVNLFDENYTDDSDRDFCFTQIT